MKNLYDYERTQSATTDLPFGALKNESSPGKQDGTDIVAEHIQDLAYSLYQVLQLAGINPNGELEDGNNKTQFIESLTNIGVFRYSDKTSYNYGVFAWQVIGNTFTLYRSLKNSNSDDVNNNESWLKFLEIGADNKINFNVDTNILGLSANPSLSNLSEAGEDRLNVSKMYETGAVSNDTKGFEALLKRAHSTFDKSKFTIEGSPNINNNGIFNNTNTNEKVNIQIPALGNNFIIECPIRHYGEKYTGSLNNLFSDSGINLRFAYGWGSTWYLDLKDTNGDIINDSSNYISYTFSTDKNYLLRLICEFKNDVYNIVYELYEEGILVKTLEITTDKKPYISENSVELFIKESVTSTRIVDLKLLRIVSDVPVFNGNKTGLFVAKPDNYEVVGSPTITEDGIASGFSNSNYITYNKQTLGDNFDIIFPKFKTPDVSQNSSFLFTTSGHGLRVQLNSGKIRTLAFSGNDQYPVIQGLTQLQNNTEYLYKISRKKESDNYVLTAFLSNDNGKTWVQQSQITMTQDLYNSDSVGYLGGNPNSADQIFKGSIDLNSFKIYVDGNLVYQPCLKIPYTEADSTSRIVDVAYRNRVQDLYEQTGEALFYTLDEQNQNFSLPAGDIYGMITKNREILDIVYPIGRPMPEENNVLLDNEVWLEGATVNIVDYPKLFKIYGTKYGGNGTTTFKLPDMRGRTLWGSPDGSNGYIESKLPNIKGNVHLEGDGGSRAKQTSTASGAFNWINPGTGASFENTGGGQPWFSDFNFDASRSNSIYSDSAKIVQPPAFKVRWKTRFE